MKFSKTEKLELLQRFEPILNFTQGELFFPFDAERYLERSSLWAYRPGFGTEKILGEGELNFERLGEKRNASFGGVQYLKFVDPLGARQFARYRLNQLRRDQRKKAFRAGPGRLARVGYSARILDALFSLTLLTRGRVTGDTAASAAIQYQALQNENEGYQYYGRVIREKDWTVLQYWFFYPFNDWRSGYYGLNDHEGDWEQISIYLYENETGDWQPEWLAYASHDFEGDNLRRNWNDNNVKKEGEHPVVFVGAGSHASFFQAGEYLTELVFPPLSPVVTGLRRLFRGLERLLGNEISLEGREKSDLFYVPFVDYARGDGLSIGKGQEKGWEKPELISEKKDWVEGYRGLWGLWTKDPVMSENAPAGPMYDRFGKVRRVWFDPLGWPGMTKVSPPNKKAQRTLYRQQAIRARRRAAEIGLAEKNTELRNLELETRAMEDRPHLQKQYERQIKQMRRLEEEIRLSKRKIAEDKALQGALRDFGEELEDRQGHGLRSHLDRPQTPDQGTMVRFRRLAEAWAAVSIGLALLAFLGIALFASDFLLFGAIIILAAIVLIEATFQGRLERLANMLTNMLALIASLILINEFFTPLVIGFVVLVGLYLLYDNLRELLR